MPGNEAGDTIHNFFLHENLPQGQNHLPSLDSKWLVNGNNVWASSQRRVASVNPSAKNYISQHSGSEKEQLGLHSHRQQGLNFAQSQSNIQTATFNGFTYGNQLYQSTHDATSFAERDAKHNQTSSGMFMYESQHVIGPENQPGSSIRPEASGSLVGIDFLGSQQQMNFHQLDMLQMSQLRQYGLNNMHPLPQQMMSMKMQELQGQQQLQRMGTQDQSMLNQFSSFGKEASGNRSLGMINGLQNADGVGYHWASNRDNTNWLQKTSSLQGSSSGCAFSQNCSPSLRAGDLVNQPVEQSLYEIPVSGSRGILNHYPLLPTDKCAVQELTSSGNYISGALCNAFPGQVDGLPFAKQRCQGENSLRSVSGQTLSPLHAENLQYGNSLQRRAPQHEFHVSEMLDVAQNALQEKVETLQEDVALDPTEEKILFGSDDNVWSAFGKSLDTGEVGGSLFDGAGFGCSVQGGTWSALMQSAVAETSSGDHEEWSGLNFENTNIPSRNKPIRLRNEVGQRPLHSGIDNLPKASLLSSKHSPQSDEININENYGVLGFQQVGGKFPSGSSFSQQENSSLALEQSASQQSDGIPPHLLGRASPVLGNVLRSLDADIGKKTISALWTAENIGWGQESSKPEGGNITGSGMPYQDAALMVHGHENSLKHSWKGDKVQVMQREVEGGTPGRLNGRLPIAEVEQVKASDENAQVNDEGFPMNNPARMMSSASIVNERGSDPFLQSSYSVNHWKNAEPMVNFKVNEPVGDMQHDEKGDNIENRGHHKENSDKQENSNDSFHSNISHRASTVPWKSVNIGANGSGTQSAGRQNPNQTGRKSSDVRKFQHHPMGNLDDDMDDMEARNGFKQPVHSEAMARIGHTKFFSQMPKNSADMGEEQPPAHHGSTKGCDDILGPGKFASQPSNLAHSNRTSDVEVLDRASQTGHNMLELIHKVDRAQDDRMYSSHLNPSSELSRVESYDQSDGGAQRSQSSNSQAFGLQLGPPSLRHTIPNQALTSPSFFQTANSLHSSHADRDIGHESTAQLDPASLVHTIPGHFEGLQGISSSGLLKQSGDAVSAHKMSGKLSSAINSCLPYSSGHLQTQDTAWGSGQMALSLEKQASAASKGETNSRPSISQQAFFPDGGGSSHDNNTSPGSSFLQFNTNNLPESVSGSSLPPVSQPPSIAGFSSQGLSKSSPNLLTNIASEHHLLRSHLQKMASQFPYQPKVVTSISPASFGQAYRDAKEQGSFPLEFPGGSANVKCVGPEVEQRSKDGTGQQVLPENMNLVHKNNVLQGKVPSMRSPSGRSPLNSNSAQGNMEAFGQSNTLKNCSSLNLVHAMQNLENDTIPQFLKTEEGQESCLGNQLIACDVGHSNAIAEGAVFSVNRISLGESTLLSSPVPAQSSIKSESSGHGNVTPQGMHVLNRDLSETGSDSSHVDHSKISAQMAPSWLNQYGTLKNEQTLPMQHTHLAAIVKAGKQSVTLGKSCNDVDILNSVDQLTTAAVYMDQVSSIQQSGLPPSVHTEHLSSQSLPASASDEYPQTLTTKKRKVATSELHPWHKEVLQASTILQSISTAEIEWSEATNRLPQKIEEDAKFLEERVPKLKSKRRLIMSTQLMQQLLRPPEPIVAMDAISDPESLLYSVARTAIGDACSMITFVNREASMFHDHMNRLSDERYTTDRLDQHLLRITEVFTARLKKLERDFLRLDRRASVLDLMVECQDLEKFSVINRFAKFHGRGQAENAENSSSDAVSNTQKPCPQRYVTAFPLPRSLPNSVQCHSL